MDDSLESGSAYMTPLRDWLHTLLGAAPETTQRLLTTLATILAVILIRAVTLRVVNKRVEDARALYRWRKAVSYIAFGIALVVAMRVWFPGLQGVSTFLGLLSAGLAIALRDPIVNLAGWAFILWRKPFEVGDRIQIGEHAGDVIDVRIFQFTLMEIGNWVGADQSTGRVIHVPNGKVFSEATANYNKGFQHIWNEIPVLVTFESDWEKAKAILTEIANRCAENLSTTAQQRLRKAAQKYMIFYSKLTPVVYTSVADSGVVLTIRYLTAPRHRRSSSEAIWEEILREFARCEDIDFAYPTQRFYQNPVEGKPGRQPEAEAGPPVGATSKLPRD
jgi:small-conductance mechanosensitive channel